MEQLMINFVEPMLHKHGGFLFLFIWIIAFVPILTMLFVAMTAKNRERNRIKKLKRIKRNEIRVGDRNSEAKAPDII
jgi:hypothetical protein